MDKNIIISYTFYYPEDEYYMDTDILVVPAEKANETRNVIRSALKKARKLTAKEIKDFVLAECNAAGIEAIRPNCECLWFSMDSGLMYEDADKPTTNSSDFRMDFNSIFFDTM